MKNNFSVSFVEGLEKVKFGLRFTYHKKKSAVDNTESKVETELYVEPELKHGNELLDNLDLMQEEQ